MISTLHLYKSPFFLHGALGSDSLQSIQQRSMAQLVEPTARTAIVSSTSFGSAAVFDYHVAILLGPSEVESLEHAVVVV